MKTKIIFLFLMNVCILSAQWEEPVEIAPVYKGYSNQPSIFAAGKRVVVSWRNTFDNGDSINELYSRDLFYGKWGDIKSINHEKSNAGHPDIAIDNNGRYHTVWGERTNFNLPIPYHPPTDVFYSCFNDSGWTKKENLFHKVDSVYRSFIDPKIRIDKNNRVHVIWGETVLFDLSLKYKRMENNVWSDIIGLPTSCAYFDYLIDDQDVIHVAFVNAIVGGEPDQSSVLYKCSRDFGKTWSDSIIVDYSGDKSAYEVKITRSKDGTIHIVWTKDFDNINTIVPDNLYHSYSKDGKSWVKAQSVLGDLQGFFSYPNIVCDSKNNLHLVYHYAPDAQYSTWYLYHSVFSGVWSKPQRMFDQKIFQYREPSLAIDELDYLHCAFIKFIPLPVKEVIVSYTRTSNPVTSLKEIEPIVKEALLKQNYPNPFNSITNISYSIPENGKVIIKIFDMIGREVLELENKYRSYGFYTSQFDSGHLPSGSYIYRLEFLSSSGKTRYFDQKIMMILK